MYIDIRYTKVYFAMNKNQFVCQFQEGKRAGNFCYSSDNYSTWLSIAS